MTALYRLTLTLSCGHRSRRGIGTLAVCEQHVPKRRNGTFAAVRCPQGCGRRRVLIAHHGLVKDYPHAEAPT